MPQITNLELKKLLDELADRVGGLEGRMNGYEQRMKENSIILTQVAAFFAFLKHFITFLKWLAGIALAVLISQFFIYIFHLFGH